MPQKITLIRVVRIKRNLADTSPHINPRRPRWRRRAVPRESRLVAQERATPPQPPPHAPCGYLEFERNAGRGYGLWPRWRSDVMCRLVAGSEQPGRPGLSRYKALIVTPCTAGTPVATARSACVSPMVPSSYMSRVDTITYRHIAAAISRVRATSEVLWVLLSQSSMPGFQYMATPCFAVLLWPLFWAQYAPIFGCVYQRYDATTTHDDNDNKRDVD